MNTTWWVSDRIQFFGNIGFGGVDTVISDSPLVEEDAQSAFFAGGTYIFGNVRRPETFISSERAGEWSWRLNYGYQADGNIISEIDAGITNARPSARPSPMIQAAWLAIW